MKKTEQKRSKKTYKIQKSDDPAFLFYFKSWLSRTGLMDKKVKGDWIDLMCYQAVKGELSLQEIKNVCGSDFEEHWKILSEFFEEKNGTFFDKKLRKVLKDRKEYCDSRRRNVLSGNRLEKKHMLSVCSTHLLLYVRNKNRNRNNSLSFSFSLSENQRNLFLSTFESFCRMRAEINRKITKKGMEILLKKLTHATEDISLQIKVLEHSIQTSTPDIYPETVLKKYEKFAGIRKRLSFYLPDQTISKILDLCPNLTLEDTNRKIELMQGKRPADPESYLYNAITKNYSPANSSSLDSENSGKPLTEAEYEKLSDKMKKKLKAEEHVFPASKAWQLEQKPERELMPHEKMIFDTMDVGDEVEEKYFMKLPETLRIYFKEVNVPMSRKKMYHWL